MITPRGAAVIAAAAASIRLSGTRTTGAVAGSGVVASRAASAAAARSASVAGAAGSSGLRSGTSRWTGPGAGPRAAARA